MRRRRPSPGRHRREGDQGRLAGRHREIYTTIGGRTAKEILEEAADGAAAAIADGAWDTGCAACEILGLDPMYVASEGVLVAMVSGQDAADALAALAALAALGSDPVGRVVGGHPGLVVLRTGIGGTRILDMLPGDQLPRIC
jgi:hypothetical protein